MAELIVDKLGSVGCKTALRITERAVSTAGLGNESHSMGSAQLAALKVILEDMASDSDAASSLCRL